MDRRIIRLAFLILFLNLTGGPLYAQESSAAGAATDCRDLETLGVVSPDGGRSVFTMDKDTADRFKRRFGVYRREGGVNFVRAPSWELVALVAQASAEHLGRTVADLKSQVDTLKGRVGNLEVRINKLEKREKARRRALDRTK